MEITTIKNNGELKQEIEIELLSCEGAKFTGSLTNKAKHGIYLLANRLSTLNGKIPLNWLNQSLIFL